MTTDHDDDDHDEFCPECWARQVALDLLERAIWNCIAADVEIEQIEACMTELLAQIAKNRDAEYLSDVPAAGSA